MTTDSSPGQWQDSPETGINPADTDPSGPPPTPGQRRRQRRRRKIEWSIAVVLIIALVPSLVWLIATVTDLADPSGAAGESAEASPDESVSADEQASPHGGPSDRFGPDDGRRPDTVVPLEDRLTAPDAAAFSGAEAELLRVLMDIDASERAMLGFQTALVDAIDTGVAGAELLELVSDRAVVAQRDLLILRDLLGEPIADADTREVAGRYVAHLDTWVNYLAALEEQPELLGGDMVRYTLPINATGGQFSLAVDARLSADPSLDERIVAYARAIIERGFPAPEQADV